MINTGLVGYILASNPSYATLPLSLQFMTIAMTIIAKSALPEERAKIQRVTDFIIFIFVASGFFLAVVYTIILNRK